MKILDEPTQGVSWILRYILRFPVSKSFLNVFRRLFLAFNVYALVLSVSYYHKVTYTIVLCILVYMMYILTSLENPTNFFLHHKSMFTDVTSFSSIWMTRLVDVDVTVPDNSTTPPLRVSFASFRVALARTELASSVFQIRRRYIEGIATGNTYPRNGRIMVLSLLFHNNNYRLREI